MNLFDRSRKHKEVIFRVVDMKPVGSHTCIFDDGYLFNRANNKLEVIFVLFSKYLNNA